MDKADGDASPAASAASGGASIVTIRSGIAARAQMSSTGLASS